MTDPLGQSQVLPYIEGLTSKGYQFYLLSCEKKKNYSKNEQIINEICKRNNITWVPLFFHTKPKIIAKYYDLYNLRKRAQALFISQKFDLIHCRSYIAIEIGLFLKRKYGVKVIFDMRGFWVDERVDGHMWNLKNPVYKLAYSYYKRKEGSYIRNADYIISLTKAGENEIKKWRSYKGVPIAVIPCSADFNLFTGLKGGERESIREKMGFSNNELVISYLGSIGSWYMLEEMLDFFIVIKRKYNSAKFFFITPALPETIYESADKKGILRNDLVIKFAGRKEVPEFVKASNINIFFIKQAYSKIASSPTKLGEIFAMGIPVICNDGVGDVREIVENAKGGYVLSSFNEESYETAVKNIEKILATNYSDLRDRVYNYYSLELAVEKYLEVYKRILGS